MFKKKKDSNDLINETMYGTGGIPLPDNDDVKIRRMEKEKDNKPRKKVGFFAKLFKPRFKRGKGVDGF